MFSLSEKSSCSVKLLILLSGVLQGGVVDKLVLLLKTGSFDEIFGVLLPSLLIWAIIIIFNIYGLVSIRQC